MVLEQLIIPGFLFIYLIILITYLKMRLENYPHSIFVIRYRNGKIINKGFGGTYFKLPLIDNIFSIDLSIQKIDVKINNIETLDHQTISITSFLIYKLQWKKIEEKIFDMDKNIVDHELVNYLQNEKLNDLIHDLIYSVLDGTTRKLSYYQLQRDREKLIHEIEKEILSLPISKYLEIQNIKIKNIDPK